jgi:hypothetical protein
MASSINAVITGGGGLIQTADSSGILALQAAGTTVATVSSTGVAITGTLSSTGILSSPLAPTAGTASVAPIQLTSGTNLTSATAGAIEYNGSVMYGTPIGTQRGIIPNEQFFALNAGLAGANATGAQSIFGVGVTLSASTVYEFEMDFILTRAAGTTAHTISLGFGGTATLNNIIYEVIDIAALSLPIAPGNNATTIAATSATATAITGSITSSTRVDCIIIKGTVSINAGGTFIPQYTLSAAPGGAYTTAAGSYMKIKPIGVSGANVSVGTWA